MIKNLLFVCALLSTWSMNSQSFQSVSVTGLTTTASDSRSVNFVDVNNDGWDDIFISNSLNTGQDNSLYLNNGNGTFTSVTSDPIVNDNSRSVGVSFADADNDGDLDAYMTTWGTATKNYFYRGNGDGTFVYESSSVSGSLATFSEMATWIDANNDQNLDIYFTNSAGNTRNKYYQNQGDGTFQDNSALTITNEFLNTRSVDWIDYDNDGDCDLFLTNENNAKNTLYRNNGANSFSKITNLTIVQDFRNSAGSSWADIDNDGDFDLFVANYNNQKNQLFRNNGSNFTEETTSVIASATSSSFGSTFGDLDNDGDLDLIVCNAYSNAFNSNFIFMNDGNGNFSKDNTSALATHQGWSYSVGLGDYNNDGWLDVVYANNKNSAQTNSLFRNTGSGNNWVKFKSVGTNSNRSAIGAKVRIRANINGNDVWQVRQVSANSGYCSQNSFVVHFGLADASIVDELEVTWPDGSVETSSDIEVNSQYTLLEGSGVLSISDPKEVGSVQIFPNPVSDEDLNIRFNLRNSATPTSYTITDMVGRVIKMGKISESVSELSLDTSFLVKGVYLISLYDTQTKLFSRKFIKSTN